MSSYLTVVPAYGRDYTSKAGVLADWNKDKDFLIYDVSSPYDGRYVNKSGRPAGVTISVRYARRTKEMQIR